jgi:conjugal transfer mating pair stabilization protein TraN
MRRMGVIAGLLLSLGAAGALGQTMQSVRDDAKAFGTAQTAASQGVADSDTTVTTNVPGYTGPTAPQSSYMADPAALDASKLSVAQSNEGYRLTVDGNLTRPRISAAEVDATVARGNAINQDPNAIVQGLANGQAGQCTQLPPSTTTTGTFEASCNSGLALVTAPRSCPIALTHSFGSASHKYQCTQIHRKGAICLQGGPRSCTEPDFVDELVGSGCEAYDASTMCTTQVVSAQVIVPQAFNRPKTTYETIEAICSGDVAGTITGGSLTTRAGTYTPSFTDLGSTPAYQGSTQDVSQCTSLASDTGCTAPVDVCTDASPTTRTINGVAITQSCWAWSRTYSCTGTIPANDCSATTIPTGCTFTRDECLDDPAPADPTECKVHQRVYTCPITGPAAQTQYVCGGDVYCINGDCEPIVREASTEFKDAVVGLNSLGQAAKEFNSIDYTLFKGTGTTCSKPVFGLGNCCGGNGFPLIGTCTAADRLLAQQIDKGLTHYVGTYCARSFLGICTTKRQSYCVFSSKLTRILQEQGRPQLGKTWGTPKTPDCSGFTVDEFSRLDLSVMNFSEIYNDFIQAARLPDEAATLTDIQARIQAYYTRGQ